MAERTNLEALYQEAKAAISSKDLARASDLLRQVMLIDDDYKDAYRLLAQVVKLRRRRWYNHPRFFIAIGLVALLVISALWAPQILGAVTSSTSSEESTSAPTPIITSAPSEAVATSVPLVWKRVSFGQDFEYDFITAIVFDPQDRDTIYIGTANSGVYKSIDGGVSWQPSHNGINHAAISAMAIDFTDSSTVYATGLLGGLYVSRDGGGHWTTIDIPGAQLENFDFSSISVDVNDSSHLLWSGSWIYESMDAGQTWTPTRGNRGEESSVVMISPEDSETFFANTFDGLHVSRDRGDSWALAGPVGYWSPQYQLAALVGDEESIFYAISDGDQGNEYQVLKASVDNGVTWFDVIDDCRGRVATGPDRHAYAICDERVYRSLDGRNWARVGQVPIDAQAIAVSPHDPNLVIVAGNGLYVSIDGGQTWEPSSDGLPEFRLNLFLNPIDQNKLYAATTDRPLYQSEDGGITWSILTDQGLGFAISSDGLTLYRTYNGTQLRVSADDGQNWETLSLPQEVSGFNHVFTHPLDQDTIYLALDGEQSRYMYYSPDRGKTWLPSYNATIAHTNLAFADDLSVAYASGWGLQRSSDALERWNNCAPSNSSVDSSSPRVIVIDAGNSDHLYLATMSRGVLISVDACKSWQTSNTGLGSLSVYTLVADPQDGDILYAGTDRGAFISYDAGATWAVINDGLLGATVVYSIVVDPDSTVYAATPYGIFILESR